MAEGKKKNWFARAFGSIARYFRELRSELKKVVWPTPKQVVKNTVVVLVCCLIIGALIWVFDAFAQYGISALRSLF